MDKIGISSRRMGINIQQNARKVKRVNLFEPGSKSKCYGDIYYCAHYQAMIHESFSMYVRMYELINVRRCAGAGRVPATSHGVWGCAGLQLKSLMYINFLPESKSNNL
jgi:hypothetical protein